MPGIVKNRLPNAFADLRCDITVARQYNESGPDSESYEPENTDEDVSITENPSARTFPLSRQQRQNKSPPTLCLNRFAQQVVFLYILGIAVYNFEWRRKIKHTC